MAQTQQAEGLLKTHLSLAHEGGVWDPEIDDVLVCTHVIVQTHDVKTFLFRSQQPQTFAYLPGQFLTFDFEIDGEVVNRCYSLSSTPTRPHLISITVKRVPGGPVSNWLHDCLKPGMQVRAVGPMGKFSSVNYPADKYLFISGGSGVAPLMSMARAYDDLSIPRDIIFAQFARTSRDFSFPHELALMGENMPNFRFVPVCEADAPNERWSGFSGRISLAMLQLFAPDCLRREFMVCGPAPFMAAVRAMLENAGFDMAHYHEESFDIADHANAQKVEARPPVAGVTESFAVEFRQSGRTVECGADTFVLDAGRAAGIQIPFFCTQGLCGTCKSKLISGKVDMHHQGGIRKREIDQGLFLPCCSKPLTDLVVDR